MQTCMCVYECMHLHAYTHMCVYVYICMCIYDHMRICIYAHTHVYLPPHTEYMPTYAYEYTPTCTCVYMPTHMCMYVYTYAYICMSLCPHTHVCMHVCVYAYVCMEEYAYMSMPLCVYRPTTCKWWQFRCCFSDTWYLFLLLVFLQLPGLPVHGVKSEQWNWTFSSFRHKWESFYSVISKSDACQMFQVDQFYPGTMSFLSFYQECCSIWANVAKPCFS